ncbi:MAG: hypothetical protein ABR532_01545 [Candidatus Dormibacteria bacterium]
MIYRGGLTGTWWCATKWKETGDGHFEAIEKYDITGQMEEILEEAAEERDPAQFDGPEVGE